MEERACRQWQRHQCFLDGHLNRSEAKVLEQLPTEYRGGQAGHGSSLYWRGAALSCREHEVTSTPWSTGGLPHSSHLAAVMKADVSWWWPNILEPSGPWAGTNFSWGSGWSLEKAMATHSSILAWRIPWTAEPGKLQSQRVGHDWTTNTYTHRLIILAIPD